MEPVFGEPEVSFFRTDVRPDRCEVHFLGFENGILDFLIDAICQLGVVIFLFVSVDLASTGCEDPRPKFFSSVPGFVLRFCT
jgi:hypothetical protein